MTHYTILPEEAYWDDKEVSDSYTEIELGGILMQVRMEQDNRATIIRLLRCSLDDYLNPAIAPGQQVTFVPILNNQ
ncbi:YlzJ-like family protein [Paenibacillus lentus]|uniref:YlzJ-like family protein n=1 Tax=Paenibacillus lentus TaxID=1338368 RepID=UPI0036483E05